MLRRSIGRVDVSRIKLIHGARSAEVLYYRMTTNGNDADRQLLVRNGRTPSASR
jgi:hypothetical protein